MTMMETIKDKVNVSVAPDMTPWLAMQTTMLALYYTVAPQLPLWVVWFPSIPTAVVLAGLLLFGILWFIWTLLRAIVGAFID